MKRVTTLGMAMHMRLTESIPRQVHWLLCGQITVSCSSRDVDEC
jgi:hypothetical protein